MAVGLVRIPLEFAHYSAMVRADFLIIGSVAITAFYAFVIAKVSAGRNWARIFWLIMFTPSITLNIALGYLSAEFTRAPAMGALTLLQMGMVVYALFLLFTQPGSVWFRKYKFA